MFFHPSIEEKNGSLLLTINVHPNSPWRKIELKEDSIEIYVNEPPDKGKANKAIIKLLSKQLRIPTSSVKIIKGHKSKRKIALISYSDTEHIYGKLKQSKNTFRN